VVGRFAYGVSGRIRASVVSSCDLCLGGCAWGWVCFPVSVFRSVARPLQVYVLARACRAV